ncbi:MAG: WD40 repeat domain-containing protein [Fimbriimonadaceae bacterium]|nr:WD40 repeat domain-containing protein [Fimbriimonadaceae bacterium]QYK55213.1 MAG: WD40 repeat domain-containing protein [Fimbriimonadaceae bacterium]
MIAALTFVLTVQAHPGGARCADFRPDGKVLATAGDDGSIKVWLTSDWSLRRQTKNAHGGHVTQIAFSGDGRLLVSGGYDGVVNVWSATDGRKIKGWRSGTSYVSGVAASRDGNRVYSCGYDNRAKMWDARTGRLLQTYIGLPSDAYGMAVSHDDKVLCAVGPSKGVVVWDVATGKKLFSGSYEGDYAAAAFSPDGRRLAVGALSGQMQIFSVPRGEPLYKGRPERTGIISLKWLDNDRLLVGSYDLTATIYDGSMNQISTYGVSKDSLFGVTATEDGKTGVFCSFDGQVVVRDLADWREIAVLGR